MCGVCIGMVKSTGAGGYVCVWCVYGEKYGGREGVCWGEGGAGCVCVCINMVKSMGVWEGGGVLGVCIGMVKSMGCGSVGRSVGGRYVYRYGEKYGGGRGVCVVYGEKYGGAGGCVCVCAGVT